MNFKDEVIQKLGLSLALCSLDDKIRVQKITLPEQDNSSVYTVEFYDNKTEYKYTINPEHLYPDEINDMLAHILSLESKDILGKKTKATSLQSFNSQIDLASQIINGKKDYLIRTYDSYMSYSTLERRNSPEREILDSYLNTLKNYGDTFYFGNCADYKTNEYKITEVMYSIMSLVSGEELCLDMDSLDKRCYPDLIIAEAYKAIKSSEKDYEDYLGLNNIKSNTPKMDLRDLRPSLDEEIYLITKYKQLGLLNGAVFRTSDGNEIPLDKAFDDDDVSYSDNESYYESLINDYSYPEDDMTNDEFDDESDCDEIDGDDGDIYGVIYKNKDAGENEISQITLSPVALNMIEKCSQQKNQKLNTTLSDILDDLFRKIDFRKTNFVDDIYNALFGTSDDSSNKNNKNTQKPDNQNDKLDDSQFDQNDDFDNGKDI